MQQRKRARGRCPPYIPYEMAALVSLDCPARECHCFWPLSLARMLPGLDEKRADEIHCDKHRSSGSPSNGDSAVSIGFKEKVRCSEGVKRSWLPRDPLRSSATAVKRCPATHTRTRTSFRGVFRSGRSRLDKNLTRLYTLVAVVAICEASLCAQPLDKFSLKKWVSTRT